MQPLHIHCIFCKHHNSLLLLKKCKLCVSKFLCSYRATDEEFVMKCDINIDSSLIKNPLPYKYYVYTKKTHTFENLDYIISSYSSIHVNRCLIVPPLHKGMFNRQVNDMS